VLHSQSGIMSSPNFPSAYNSSTECVWDVNVSPGYHMNISFNEPFDIEYSPSCTNDYVQVRVFYSGLISL